MIDPKCSEIGNLNRKLFDGGSLTLWDYPEGCECACMHRMPVQWEKMYSCKPPWQVDLDIKEIL